MATHSSTLAWKLPWTEEPGRLQSMGSLRVGHNWETSLSLFLSCTGEGNGNALQCSCLENPRDGGAWWAAVYGVTQSRPRLKRLSSSSMCMWNVLHAVQGKQHATISSVQLLSHVRLFATPWTAARQASLCITNSQSLLKLTSTESVMPCYNQFYVNADW